MKTLTKSMLALTLAGFGFGLLLVTDVINAGDAVGWYMVLPLGAVFFGMFLICLILEKESALFDLQQDSHLAQSPKSAQCKSAAVESHGSCSAKAAH